MAIVLNAGADRATSGDSVGPNSLFDSGCDFPLVVVTILEALLAEVVLIILAALW